MNVMLVSVSERTSEIRPAEGAGATPARCAYLLAEAATLSAAGGLAGLAGPWRSAPPFAVSIRFSRCKPPPCGPIPHCWSRWPSGCSSACYRRGVRRGSIRFEPSPGDEAIVATYDLFRFAASSVLAHRLRSILTMLGIVIGIASVTLLTSVGQGTREYILSEFTQFGTNLLQINPGKTTTAGIPGARAEPVESDSGRGR